MRVSAHRTTRGRCHGRFGALRFKMGVLVCLITSLASSCPQSIAPRQIVVDAHAPWSQQENLDFESQAKLVSRQRGVSISILERPVLGQTELMKIAVIYPEEEPGTTDAPLRPVAIAPGFSAGGVLYLEYACNLADRNFAVFLPDYKGDFIHFFGLEPFRDPLLQTDAPNLRSCLEKLASDVAAYTGDYSIDAGNVLDGMDNIRDQTVADLIRANLFAYRGDCLDATVCAIFDIAEDPTSPLYGRIDTSRIGLESHSLGADEVTEALVRRDGRQKYWWTNSIAVVVLKGATIILHGNENMRSINTPVFFMNGEYDDPAGVMDVTWERFNHLDAPSGYITLSNCGHMVFIDAPIGFFGDKLVPLFGQYRDIHWYEFVRNRTAIVDLSAALYDAFLSRNPDAISKVCDGTLEFEGTYQTRNIDEMGW